MMVRVCLVSPMPLETRAWMAAAQQLAEADPAGWGIGWSVWPAGVPYSRGEAARIRRAA